MAESKKIKIDSKALRRALVKKGLSQAEASRRIGYSAGFICKALRNSEIGKAAAISIENVLGIPFDLYSAEKAEKRASQASQLSMEDVKPAEDEAKIPFHRDVKITAHRVTNPSDLFGGLIKEYCKPLGEGFLIPKAGDTDETDEDLEEALLAIEDAAYTASREGVRDELVHTLRHLAINILDTATRMERGL